MAHWDTIPLDILRTLIAEITPSNGAILGRLCCACKIWKASLETTNDLWTTLASATPSVPPLQQAAQGKATEAASVTSLRTRLNDFHQTKLRMRNGQVNVSTLFNPNPPGICGPSAAKSRRQEGDENDIGEGDGFREYKMSSDAYQESMYRTYHHYNQGSDRALIIIEVERIGSSWMTRSVDTAKFVRVSDPSEVVTEIIPFRHSIEGVAHSPEVLEAKFFMLGSRFVFPASGAVLTLDEYNRCTGYDLGTMQPLELNFSDIARSHLVSAKANPHHLFPHIAILNPSGDSKPADISEPRTALNIYDVETGNYCLRDLPLVFRGSHPPLFEFLGPYIFISTSAERNTPDSPFAVYEFDGGCNGKEGWSLVRASTFTNFGRLPQVHSVHGSIATISTRAGPSRHFFMLDLATGRIVSRRTTGHAPTLVSFHADSRLLAVEEGYVDIRPENSFNYASGKSLAIYDLLEPENSPPLLCVHRANSVAFLGAGRLLVENLQSGMQFWDFVSPLEALPEARLHVCALTAPKIARLRSPKNSNSSWVSRQAEVEAHMELVSLPFSDLFDHVATLLGCKLEELQTNLLSKYGKTYAFASFDVDVWFLNFPPS